MLYKYQYIKKHPLHGLHKHLLFFFRKIESVPRNTSFRINGNYFHSDFSAILNASTTLTEKFKSFFNSYKKLTQEQRKNLHYKIAKCQDVKCFFEDTSIDCSDITRGSIKQLMGDDTLYDLMKYLFESTLKSSRWKIEEHYKQLYANMPIEKVCPFCGVENMHQTFREDYDHLLPKSIYPLLAVNLYNLVPMCSVCNEKAKKEIDILYKNGVRRSFAYPYTTELSVTFSFGGSIIPQTDINNENGQWTLTINTDNEKNISWLEIFNIERRYIDDYLKFDSWTYDFVYTLVHNKTNIENEEQLKIELLSVAKLYEKRRLSNCNIIKAPLFYYLAGCNNQIFYNSLMRKYNELKRQAA